MYFQSLKIFILIGSLILMQRGEVSSNPNIHDPDPQSKSYGEKEYPDRKTRPEGYRAVIKYMDGFIAAGSGGRIDWISVSGEIARSERFPGDSFNCLLSYDQKVFAAGDNGTILVSSGDGALLRIESGTRKNINSLALFNGIIIAGTDGGNILLGDRDGIIRIISLTLKGNIVSVSAGKSECYGVTDEGEFIRSENGSNWNVLDFNSVYSGYYETCFFTRVLATENRIIVTGVRDNGLPVLFFSHLGGVWTERHLNYTDDKGTSGFLTDAPNDVFYDDLGDRVFLTCDDGKILMLPSCTQCNELRVLSSDDLEGIAGNGNTIIIAGENFSIKTLDLR